jgi:hypothetical protein
LAWVRVQDKIRRVADCLTALAEWNFADNRFQRPGLGTEKEGHSILYKVLSTNHIHLSTIMGKEWGLSELQHLHKFILNGMSGSAPAVEWRINT